MWNQTLSRIECFVSTQLFVQKIILCGLSVRFVHRSPPTRARKLSISNSNVCGIFRTFDKNGLTNPNHSVPENAWASSHVSKNFHEWFGFPGPFIFLIYLLLFPHVIYQPAVLLPVVFLKHFTRSSSCEFKHFHELDVGNVCDSSVSLREWFAPPP